jgi:hypothetical protein
MLPSAGVLTGPTDVTPPREMAERPRCEHGERAGDDREHCDRNCCIRAARGDGASATGTDGAREGTRDHVLRVRVVAEVGGQRVDGLLVAGGEYLGPTSPSSDQSFSTASAHADAAGALVLGQNVNNAIAEATARRVTTTLPRRRTTFRVSPKDCLSNSGQRRVVVVEVVAVRGLAATREVTETARREKGDRHAPEHEQRNR